MMQTFAHTFYLEDIRQRQKGKNVVQDIVGKACKLHSEKTRSLLTYADPLSGTGSELGSAWWRKQYNYSRNCINVGI